MRKTSEFAGELARADVDSQLRHVVRQEHSDTRDEGSNLFIHHVLLE